MINIQKSLEFQLYDWLEGHEAIKDEDSEYDDDLPGQFIIHSFGRTDEGKSVYAKIINYTPYFYILLPNKLQNKPKSEIEQIVKKIREYFKGKDNKVYYKFKSTLTELQPIKLKRAEGFTNDKDFWFVRLIFSNADGMKKYKNYLENNEITISTIKELSTKPVKFKLYEANLPPMFRCFHIREISGCAWIETSDYELVTDEDSKDSKCDIEIIVDWRKINPITKDHNAPFRICSFDIECTSIDGEFPQAIRKGDQIIQIGATYTYIGNSIPYRQYIACLGETSLVENTIVESCETEKELMLKFLDEINNNDCDIITGYNIFFFDEKYMYDRCKEILKIDIEMAYMSKLKNFKCNFKDTKLASSALGENQLRLWETPGRVHVDLMKDVQKTFSLPCYKLDYVASKFIRGEVLTYKALGNNQFELECKSVSDIYKSDYIHLEVIKGFVSDEVGEKYLVLDVNSANKKIIVKGDTFLASELDTAKLGGVINWSQAKDDVGPKDIFKLQKGSADDRAIVAKYCVKDCKLVNLLMNKLEVITKNIEMANVCFVPLSFLFIRGQGIKLFSLCMREFRKQKYAFPVLKIDKQYKCNKCTTEYFNKWECPKCHSKNREEIENESSSYEGAIVFDPIPKVDYEALATKDYASLYPSSILHKNMSHETIVEDPEYDNLPGVKYYNANFKESDGSIQYRRFAQIENKFGVIPKILDDLLKTRKSIKKQMKNESDPFKYKILDAKQLAVKVTANSLYGQLGAPTSPVCKRDIAACTTSTGREMLILAKKYDEEQLPWIMNGLKYFYESNQLDKVNHMYDLELKARNDHKLIDNIKKYITQDISKLTFQPIIRYGDSVIGKTPLLLRNKSTKNIFIDLIENISQSETYVKMKRTNTLDTKESVELDNYETWTEKGWTTIQRVIRHKLIKDKKLFRITTHTGSVVVTDDHSLITSEGKEIKPKDVKIGLKLLHSFPQFTNLKSDIFNPKIMSFTDNDIGALEYCIQCAKNNISYIIESNYKTIIIIPNTVNENSDAIKKIEEWTEPEEYVYDLTTDNHHFHAGVGSMIVHNTDSIFSCYRFRENTVSVHKDTALKVWKKVIGFAKTLIEPYFSPKEREIFVEIFNTYYSDDKICDLTLPEYTECLPEPLHHAVILPIEERIKQFVKEYMEESYIPWLWTLAELVEKDYTFMFDIKLTQWAEHQLTKIRLIAENMDETRRNYLIKPTVEYLNIVFPNNKYFMPSDSVIYGLADKLDKTHTNAFPYANEICAEKTIIIKACKNLLEKTIKEKWIYSGEKKELTKIIDKFLADVVNLPINDNTKIVHFITEFIGANKSMDLNKLCELFNKNLLSDQDMGIDFDKDKLCAQSKEFIELYIKSNGKKTIEEIVEDFLIKEFTISFDMYKQNHYKKVIDFVENNMRYEDMSDMDENKKYSYYWLQPRWDFDMKTKRIIRYIDIYEGGQSITDKRTLDYGMDMGKLSGELIKSHLPFPHDCEYEKTFWPFAILCKKKYVGNKYEDDPIKFKQDFMGIVLKRRDNSPIVKEICGGIIDYLINHRSPQDAKNYTRKCLQNMFDGKYDIKYFLTSKTLKMKESYKDWKKIAHVYLAEKIAQRDPGNMPQSGDRIEYAVIKVPMPTDGSKLLQGDIIETPKFIKEQKLEIDYLFYLTNQIMNPALQFLELVDKNAESIFNEFIQIHTTPKVKKIKAEKPIKEPKVKVMKEPKVKVMKEPKVKVMKENKSEKLPNESKSTIKKTKKIIDSTNNINSDQPKNKSALDILVEINKKKLLDNEDNLSSKSNELNKYISQINNFIDEINNFMDKDKINIIYNQTPFDSDTITISQLSSFINNINYHINKEKKTIDKNKQKEFDI
jgi:DNA polymerase elongation subunit (family B)